jgi:hypothetical protein
MGQNASRAVELEMVMCRVKDQRCALSCSVSWLRKLIREVVCRGSNVCLSARVTWCTQLQTGGSAQVETALAASLNGLRPHVG